MCRHIVQVYTNNMWFPSEQSAMSFKTDAIKANQLLNLSDSQSHQQEVAMLHVACLHRSQRWLSQCGDQTGFCDSTFWMNLNDGGLVRQRGHRAACRTELSTRTNKLWLLVTLHLPKWCGWRTVLCTCWLHVSHSALCNRCFKNPPSSYRI